MADETAPATGADGTEPLGDGGRKALDSERRLRRDAEARARQAESAFSDLVAEQRRESVASTKGVPAELLTGESEEELTASADALNAWKTPPVDDSRFARQRPREALMPDPGSHADPPPDFGSIADRVRI